MPVSTTRSNHTQVLATDQRHHASEFNPSSADAGSHADSGYGRVRPTHPGLDALGLPASPKQRRIAVKKLVADIEKLQLEGVRNAGASSSRGAQGDRSGYVAELTGLHARLVQYIEAGLSSAPPDFSLSRSTKNGLAHAGGVTSLAVAGGTVTAAIVASTAVALACTPVTAALGAVGGALGGVGSLVCSEDGKKSDVITYSAAGLGLGAVAPMMGVLAALDGEGEFSGWLHARTFAPILRISQFGRSRDYARRPRLSTAEIAMTCESRVANELQQHLALAPAQSRTQLQSLTLLESLMAALPAESSRPARSVSPPVLRRPAASSRTQVQNWSFAETERNASSFNLFQARVTGTNEYNNVMGRPGLVQRVNALVDAMRESPRLRQLCFAIAADALDSCTDRIALALNDMEAAFVNEKAETGQLTEEQLLDAGFGKFKLQILDEIALGKVANLRRRNVSADEIEIRLIYTTRLVDRLNLPGVVRSMEYGGYANISNREINQAEAIVKNRFKRNEQIDFLARWEPWCKSLERSNPREYVRLRRVISAERNALSIAPEGMSEQQWIAALEQQKNREEERFFALAKELTNRFIASRV